ncbi:UDP-N-acetylmuramoyl-L-alanyl-D-glutamate--2,6-diaminopimelate ligase [Methylophaga nitratireducenticrescens]|uniref:UDP-N-acetylmuramoyl-L-alanyl-D-glutamate--2,6-diaminopimelate ligase n=1 Tax=Methylophaga nitratireducenticrescens TaxID=754476 RepID=I1XHI4_METNJ|nr:UDP-N-acetylmuramoyl-L-alanyl-D-glutamate--2,6-diaminopimelate ligase [Methylophaga nitratireducenticrescens]AFI83853.1 UDP-N-acetylmuramoyl-L-alanyl-D-glutamate--2,6-diaminopimelate ligase [Methylophaga nitratireducenticrescens]AUZ83970.1 UDP-N-acetylmuramoyl-L-alanyl-D-glutamate--2,6-diaminopimelate ligase [Methylophaga nitratireducenticrescens]
MNYQMRLIDLMQLVDSDTVSTTVVTGLSLDSRRLKSGDLFFALATDLEIRAQHIKQAATAEIAAVCYSAEAPLNPEQRKNLQKRQIEMVAVDDLKEQTARLAAAFYQYPSATMTVIAVTGTNGKTSVTQFIAQALENAGQPCGVIGTLGSGRITEIKDHGMTTPDPVRLQAMLAEMRDSGIRYVAVEASSHALEQGRLNFVDINYAVLTNLSRDHLDYHQNMEEYAAAKQRLFDFASLEAAVVNADDDFGQQILSLLNNNQITSVEYSCRNSKASLFASDIQPTTNGLQFNLHNAQQTLAIQTRLLGRFNVENLLATAGVLALVGWSTSEIADGLNQLTSVNGRMQLLASSLQPSVVIDFAHTPDALEKALLGMRQHMDSSSKLWCVFGCGGERDKGKRPLMGKTVSELADKLVVTDDNPRGEKSMEIIEQILTGCHKQADIHIEADRKLAIEYAIIDSALDDMVLIAGKGHEQFQEVAGVKTPFNDNEIAMQAIQKRHSATRVTL